MTKVIAFNGSPRKTWNTAMLLRHALEGAQAKGAETRLVHLYDLDFKGCTSCFACKRKATSRTGRCVMRDDLSPLLEEVAGADALFIGAPIYFGVASGETRSFLERLLFPYLIYSATPASCFPRQIPVGLFYTMNIGEDVMTDSPFAIDQSLKWTEAAVTNIFGHAETLYCCDTLQFEDYAAMDATRFDGEAKAKRRREEFPRDCAKARDMGERFVAGTWKST